MVASMPAIIHVALAILLLISTVSCSDHCPYYISPSCPSPVNPTHKDFTSFPNTTSHCFTLSDVVSNPDGFLASNTTLLFLPGDHSLEEQPVSVSNASDITLSGYSHGDKTPRITCRNSSLSFSGVSNLLVMSLDFVGCRVELSSTTVAFNHTSFADSRADYGGAIVAYGSIANFENNTFVGNTATIAGGAVWSDNSTLSFSGNTTFEDNQACAVGGGGLFLGGSLANFTGIVTFTRNKMMAIENCSQASFKENYAHYLDEETGGGGVLAIYSTLLADGEIIIEQNTVNSSAVPEERCTVLGGGGIYLSHSNAIFNGSTQISNCSTTECGGGVYVVHSNLSMEGTNTFISNHVGFNGGGVFVTKSTVEFRGTNTFLDNAAYGAGNGLFALRHSNVIITGNTYFTSVHMVLRAGAMHFHESNYLQVYGNCTFKNNSAVLRAGAMYFSRYNHLQVYGNCTFKNNSAQHAGGVYVLRNNSLSFDGYTSFLSNSAERGGAMRVGQSNNLTFLGVSRFEYNTVVDMGGALDVDHYNNVSFQGWNTFTHNSGRRGGALFVQKSSHLSLDGDNTFSQNTGQWGGAITGWQYSIVSITGNTILEYNSARIGAGLYVLQQSMLTISGNVTCHQNDATYFGAGIAVRDSTAVLDGYTNFAGNTAKHGGGIFTENGYIILKGAGSFSDNVATTVSYSGFGGAVHASSSTVEFEGTDWVIINNTADYGGGIALTGIEDRTLFLRTNTTIVFETNVARNRGGALFVENNPYVYCEFEGNNQSTEVCFLQHVTRDCYAVLSRPEHDTAADNVHLVFVNNSAGQVGNVLHGGSLESCGYCTGSHGAYYTSGLEVFNIVANSTSSPDRTKDISSEPFKMCACKNSQPICGQKSTIWKVFPQQTVLVSAAALGQMNTVVPAVVRAVVSDGLQLNESQVIQSVGTECTDLQYTLTKVNSSSGGEILLYSDEPCSVSGSPLTAVVEFLPCPIGFTTNDNELCDCEERLGEYVSECNVIDSSFLRSDGSNYWVGFVNSTSEVILHPHCPFDFCTEKETRFTLDNTDLQCVHHRSGMICGACQPGFSLALGSSRCLSCSNAFLALLIPFALAGIALVVLLFALHLTASTGTISGLVFYANILVVNKRIFFPPGETNILTVFIAWMNLDLGIETCFFDGLDTYIRTWLQFVFPVYIWLLVGLVALLATVSNRLARAISDTNPIAVLATLFLLSYTKLIRTTCSVAFSFTTLDYPGDKSRVVWLHDGNVGYLDTEDGRHIALFVTSVLLFFFVFLPYSLLLFFGQWLRSKMHFKSISKRSTLRLKSFLDAYQAPYKDEHRYWVGLLLFIRLVILVVSAIIDVNSPQDPRTILVVMQVILVLLTWPIGRGIYKKWYLDVLEASFILNLLILIGGTYHVTQSGGSQAALVYTSVSVAFVTFAGIVIFSLSQRKRVQEYRESIAHKLLSKSQRSSSTIDDTNAVGELRGIPNHLTTYSVVDIHEDHAPCRQHRNRETSVELREPVLEMVTNV